MKLTCFARPPKFRNRMVMMIIGILLQGLGLSLLIKLNLGTDPCSCLTQGVIRHVPISFGTAQLLCHLVTFLFVVRFDMSLIGFGTIGNMVCLGYIADFWGWVWNSLLPEDFFRQPVARYGLLLPALVVFILGAATYMTAGPGCQFVRSVPICITAAQQKHTAQTDCNSSFHSINLRSFFPSHVITGPRKNATATVTMPTSPPRRNPATIKQMSHIILTALKDSLCTCFDIIKGRPS